MNNAGYAQAGVIEGLTLEECYKQFETNFFGVIRTTKAVLPSMRNRKSGRVIAVTSVGGLQGTPFNDIYCASKFAVEGLYESMASVYKAFNVHVVLVGMLSLNFNNVEPGAILTTFVQNADRKSLKVLDSEWNELVERYSAAMGGAFKAPYAQTGEQVSNFILKAIEDENPNLRYTTNPLTESGLKLKYSDLTGNAIRDAMATRFGISKKT